MPTGERPTFQDWLLLAIALVFVACGIVLLPSQRDVAIVTLAMFGSCLVVFVWQIWDKLRPRLATGMDVSVAGGVPIRARPSRPLGLGVWMLALGATMFAFGGTYPLVFRIIALFIAGVGATLLGAVVFGFLGQRYLQFDPAGLTVAERGWRVRIPWDQIADVMAITLHGNPVLLLLVDDLEQLDIEPRSATARANRHFDHQLRWTGAPIAISTWNYGIDIDILAAAIRRYGRDRDARAELRLQISSSSI